MTTLLATVFVLGVLVFVHELGHFLSAKAFKIRVERFSLGYPPRLTGKKIGDTDYCVSAIPFGGYVKISGMVDESMDTKTLSGPPQPWEFRSKPWLNKFIVILAGSVMNLVLAYAIFVASTWVQGVPEVKGPWVGEATVDMPAAASGIRAGDRISRVDSTDIASWEQLTGIIHSSPGKSLKVQWTRGDSSFGAMITPVRHEIATRDGVSEVGLIGISPLTEMRKVGPFQALAKASENYYYFVKLICVSFYRLIIGRESMKSLSGPLFIAKLAGDSAKSGIGALFEFMAILSLNLGLLNLLPLPVLDGGHLLILSIEGILRREIPVKAKIVIQYIGMFLLFGLMLFAVYNDILRIFKH
jgi:regulator of sigma E protease